MNGDGKPDLAVANSNSYTVGVLLGNGDGTFQTQKTFTPGVSPDSVVVADVNGDGKPDLVVTNYNSQNVSVLLGNGDGPSKHRKPILQGSHQVRWQWLT